MSARDKLAEIISDAENCTDEEGSWALPEDVADAVVAAGWRPPMRVISTVEELEALLPRTMILDGDDAPWAKNSYAFFDVWVIPAGSMERTSADLLREMPGPFRVVWEPEGEA